MIDTTRISPTPAELADLLDQAAALLDHDREVAAVLTEARNRLRTLAWNRYAARQTRASARHAFARRHRPA